PRTGADACIWRRLWAVLRDVGDYVESFEFAKACDALFHFAWDEVCDWYIELVKPALSRGGEVAEASRRVLGHVLDYLLRQLHPFMPFVTERLWTTLTGGESVVIAPWPTPEPPWRNEPAERKIADLQRLVTEVRRFRADQGLKPSQRVAARLSGLGDDWLGPHEPVIRSLLRLDEPGESFTTTASLAVGDVTVELDTAGAIDVAAERKRLEKDLAAARKELDQAERKLGNEQFLNKAPAEVVQKVRERREAALTEIERIERQLAALPAADPTA